ncbi:hypothetical protein HDU67_005022 [Dinochytrium kinnereticum]|nr:hypothetical protein HDU67_005022 [Dinochytrium kinnereticum]
MFGGSTVCAYPRIRRARCFGGGLAGGSGRGKGGDERSLLHRVSRAHGQRWAVLGLTSRMALMDVAGSGRRRVSERRDGMEGVVGQSDPEGGRGAVGSVEETIASGGGQASLPSVAPTSIVTSATRDSPASATTPLQSSSSAQPSHPHQSSLTSSTLPRQPSPASSGPTTVTFLASALVEGVGRMVNPLAREAGVTLRFDRPLREHRLVSESGTVAAFRLALCNALMVAIGWVGRGSNSAISLPVSGRVAGERREEGRACTPPPPPVSEGRAGRQRVASACIEVVTRTRRVTPITLSFNVVERIEGGLALEAVLSASVGGGDLQNEFGREAPVWSWGCNDSAPSVVADGVESGRGAGLAGEEVREVESFVEEIVGRLAWHRGVVEGAGGSVVVAVDRGSATVRVGVAVPVRREG